MQSALEVLLGLDAPRGGEWPKYEVFGISPEHTPELIRIATDPELNWAETYSPESWAPVHAWRALGQLRSEAAVAPLVELLERSEDDDWVMEDLPRVFELIGRPAVGELTKYFTASSPLIFARMTAAEGLKKIALRDPDYRAECIETLCQVLRNFEVNDDLLNSLIIGDLIDLQAVETADLMREVFESGRVDIRHQGDWEDVQIELGLLAQRVTPRPSFDWFGSPHFSVPATEAEPKPGAKAHAKKKNKRKESRRSRNRNRRKR